MRLDAMLSGASLVVAIAAFALAAALSLRARVEPLYAVARSIVAFVGVLWLARWAARALDGVGATGSRTVDAGEMPEQPAPLPSSAARGRRGDER